MSGLQKNAQCCNNLQKDGRTEELNKIMCLNTQMELIENCIVIRLRQCSSNILWFLFHTKTKGIDELDWKTSPFPLGLL